MFYLNTKVYFSLFRYTIWFGEMPVVCVDDYRTIIDAYQRDGDAHSDRLKSTSEFYELVRGWHVQKH